ncbi:LysR family transcriptional regulator [Lachnoclostridium phytofermentans]|uniref:Transcriptional regulator, LysR family n=1 Tax=Lachnoclostridium phytofermentans (strain ATCC 700394 / DSM 18823 / ISDg) TaxID=357809 RepID=A9KT60_LACP7|nr:LysR family transcriptional regulator [Lachnoclostridium phytofermentans]ABX42271.1 transcriptional regulator, LysR family [Lachnoclostridium phytofermentans ISDg]
MTIRHFKIFIAVVECGKMRRAAERLYISQPAISQAIQELEEHYQVKLFERLSQKLSITEMGELLLPYARQAVELFENTEQAMKNAGEVSRIRLGTSISVGTTILNDLLDRYEEIYGNLDTSVIIHNTQTIETLIHSCKLDLGIVEGFVIDKGMKQIPICEDELVLVVGKSHPLYQKEIITFEELQNEILISREEGSVNRNQFEQLLLERDITMQKKWTCTNSEAIKIAVEHGRGLAILSQMIIRKEVEEGTLKILQLEDIHVHRKIHLIYHKDKFLSKPLKQFIELCLSKAH